MNTSDFEKINDLLKTNSNVITFIKDFILRFRFADLAVHSFEHFDENAMFSFHTTHQMCTSYEKAADKIIDKYNKNVRKICSSTNVKTYCENDKLLDLKKILDDEKQKAFDSIIHQYNDIDAFGYNSGRLSDFMIYSEYLEYITSDNFYYDENNPYIVELFYDINEFLRIRENVENNGTNIADMIIQFNNLCDDAISQYWDKNQKDYYGRIKEIFLYDFYADDTEDLIEAKMHDKNRVTLYEKVLDYLKVLTKYTAPVSNEAKYENLDVNTIINMGDVGDDDPDNTKKLNKLKKIAITFVSLRKIETEIDPSFFKQYMNNEDLNSLFTLRTILGQQMMTLKDYTVACTVNPALLAYEEVMKKYQGMIKGITDNESKILRELSDRAIKWYLDNSSKIDSGEIFKQFEEIAWPTSTIIHKDNIPYDFYFIEHKKSDDTKKSNAMPIDSNDPLADYPFSTDSLYTQQGINTIGYWLKYCAVATIVNCMLPMYWATGIIIAGAPVRLPIIFIPIVVISHRVLMVIGIGLCGICPLPMVLYMNVGDIPGCTIPVMNILVDKLKKLPPMLADAGNILIKTTVKGLIKTADNQINNLNSKISDLNKKILNLDAGVKVDRETERNIKKRNKMNSTTNAT